MPRRMTGQGAPGQERRDLRGAAVEGATAQDRRTGARRNAPHVYTSPKTQNGLSCVSVPY